MNVYLPIATVVALLVASLACGMTSSSTPTAPVTPTSSPVSTPASTPPSPTATPAPSPTPTEATTTEPTPVPTPTPVEGPGYGGHFIDPEDNSIVYVYLVNPSPEAVREVTSTHLAPAVYEGIKKIREVRPLQANYTFRQLQRFSDKLRDSGVWDIPEVTSSDVNEGINQIEYGIDCEQNRDRVQQQIHDLLSRENIPIDAVKVTVRGRVQFGGPPKFGCAPGEKIDPATGVSSPGFGGMFWELGTSGSWTLNVYMLEPSQQKAEELALQVIGRDNLDRVSTIRALQGKYTWEQLLEWFYLIYSAGLDVPGADLVPDFMDEGNRLIIEINREHNPDVEAEVEVALEQWGIPTEAVHLED